MEVKQISSILNDVFFPEATGERSEETKDIEIFADDLSNVGTDGFKIEASSIYNNNINKALKTIFDKVGQTIFRDVNYSSGGFDIVATDAEYGSILEKIRVEAPDFDINKSWSFNEGECSSHEEMFGLHLTDTDAKYFNSTATFASKPYTIYDRQARSAFKSRDDLIRFFGAIEARVKSKRNLAINLLTHKAVVGLMAEKLKSNHNVYKLLNEYRKETGDVNVNKNNWKCSSNFLVWVSTYINTIYDIMAEPTGLFNEDSYISQTTDEDRCFYLISDLSRALGSKVYRVSFNKDEGKLHEYKTIAYWQSVGTDGSYKIRSSIKAIPISEGERPAHGDDTRKVVEVSDVVGVIFNKWGCCVNAKDLYTSATPNTMDGWTNFVPKFDAGYLVDTSENAVVFVLGDDPITMIAEKPDTPNPWGDYTPSDFQNNITVADKFVFGTLKYMDDGLAPSGTLSGAGHFMMVKFNNVPDDADVYVGLSPSMESGLVKLDEDRNVIFKIANTSQKIVVNVKYNNGNEEYYEYSLANLILER